MSVRQNTDVSSSVSTTVCVPEFTRDADHICLSVCLSCTVQTKKTDANTMYTACAPCIHRRKQRQASNVRIKMDGAGGHLDVRSLSFSNRTFELKKQLRAVIYV